VVHLCVSFGKLIAETCVLLLLVQIKLHLLYAEKLRDISTVKNPAVLRHVVNLVCSRAATLRELQVYPSSCYMLHAPYYSPIVYTNLLHQPRGQFIVCNVTVVTPVHRVFIIQQRLCMEHCKNDTDKENRNSGRQACPSATLCSTNLTRIDPGSKQDLRRYKPATGRPNHGTFNRRLST